MRSQVKHTVSRCFASLRGLRQIRRCVPPATFRMMVVALVHSRLDYGNGVLVGLPAYLMRQLQSVLNAAARLIWRKLKRHLFCQSFPGFCYWHLHVHLQWTLQWQCHLGHSKKTLIDWLNCKVDCSIFINLRLNAQYLARYRLIG